MRKVPSSLFLPAMFVAIFVSACTFDPSGIDGCVDQCTLKQTRCDGDVLKECQQDDTGCWIWHDATDCTVSGMECVTWEDEAYCGPGCHCVPGDKRCSEDLASVESCMSSKGSCYWQVSEGCDFDEECTADPEPACTPKCDCTVGETRCASDLASVEECQQGDQGCGWVVVESCASGTQCTDDPSPSCEDCVECTPGEATCLTSENSLQLCNTYGNGCSREELVDCGTDGFCDPMRLECDSCAPCSPGDTTCSDDGRFVLQCETVRENCNGFKGLEQCSPEPVSWCETGELPGSDAQCIIHGNVCSDAVFVPVGINLLFDDFSSTFSDDVTRRYYTLGDPRSDADTFLMPWNLPTYGSEAYFSTHLQKGETVRLTASNPDTFLWSLDDTCPATPINYEIGELVFGAPWDGTFVFAVEVPQGATHLEVSIEDATTVCDVYGTYVDSDASPMYQPITMDSTHMTACFPMRRNWPPSCVQIQTQEGYGLLAWITSADGNGTGPYAQLRLYDENGNPVEVFSSGQNKTHEAINFPMMGRRAFLYKDFPAGGPRPYTLCLENAQIDNLGGRMPYVAVHMMVIDPSLLPLPGPGEVEISEIMFAGSDKKKNWVELHNKTDTVLSLKDCTLIFSNAAGETRAFDIKWDDNHKPALTPDRYFIAVGDGPKADADGLVKDYAHNKVKEAQDIHATTVSLECGGNLVDVVSLPEDTIYAETDRSVSLDPFAPSNDATDAWCLTPPVPYPQRPAFARAGYGTPSGSNPPCDLLDWTPMYDFDATHICTSGDWIYISHVWDSDQWPSDPNVQCTQDGALVEIDDDDIQLKRLKWKGRLDLRGYTRAFMLMEYTFSPGRTSRARPLIIRDYYVGALYEDREEHTTPVIHVGRLSDMVVGKWRGALYASIRREERNDHDRTYMYVRRMAIFAW